MANCLNILRRLPLADFAELMFSMPREELPSLSRLLPRMAPVEAQRKWTGFEGAALLRQTVTFVRGLACAYATTCRRPLSDARVLDFGCGYGRHLRAMAYFSDPENLYGCDPWLPSLARCREDNLFGHLAASQFLPIDLPFSGTFDLIYAFSVFTHLSARATRQSFDVLRDYLKPGGLFAITIRPIEYWIIVNTVTEEEKCRLRTDHQERGFAFLPQDIPPIDGNIYYGETSMTVEYVLREFPRFRLIGLDRDLEDPHQLVVYLA
jgi:SAM-dependent methyltransferase